MKSATDSANPPLADHTDTGNRGGMPLPSNWREALLTLIASRLTLVQLEAKEAASQGAKNALLLVVAAICAFFTWTLLLAGAIAAMAAATGWKWYWITIAAAAAHAITAVLCLRSAKSSGKPPFPVTRSEFQKDREWLENFQKPRKSNV